MIYEQILKSWDEFDRIANKRNYRQWIYRGHQDSSWQLKSSIFRSFEDADTIIENGERVKTIVRSKHEKVMIDRFKSNAHLYLSHLPSPEDSLSWLALMQHYGAPTRLLDFSFSPYVAAYFALEFGTGDASIYCLKHSAFKRVDRELHGASLESFYEDMSSCKTGTSNSMLYAFEPEFTSQRLMAQQGVFLTPDSLEMSHEKILSGYELGRTEVYRWIIPEKLRYDGIRLLKQKNITSAILYPGVEGFCRSLQHQPILDARLQEQVQ